MKYKNKDKIKLLLIVLVLVALVFGVIGSKIPKTIFNRAAEKDSGIRYPFPSRITPASKRPTRIPTNPGYNPPPQQGGSQPSLITSTPKPNSGCRTIDGRQVPCDLINEN